MKQLFVLVVLAFLFTTCTKNQPLNEIAASGITEQVKAKIAALGFATDEILEVEDGFVVEGDIFLSRNDLNTAPVDLQSLIVGETEQYNTTYLVTGLPRNITVRLNTSGMTTAQSTAMSAATDAAIARYNAEGLQLAFSRVTSGGSIVIKKAPNGAGYIASAGFPTSTGNPYNSILFNLTYSTWNANTLTSVLAHEMGHCIGMRHTDYMDRSYSCGGAYANEGASSVGAVLIPGTPATADPNSWMLACIGNGINRPFNANDVTALNYLY
jgi:hypothetical protein